MAQFHDQIVFDASGTVISASGNTSAQNVELFNELLVVVTITAVSGTSPSLTVQLQSSVDGTNFVNLGSPTSALTTTGSTTISIPNTTPMGQLVRASCTLAGSASPTVTCSIIGYAKG